MDQNGGVVIYVSFVPGFRLSDLSIVCDLSGRDVTQYRFQRMKCERSWLRNVVAGANLVNAARHAACTVGPTSKFSRQVRGARCRFFPRSETPSTWLLAILLVSQKFLCLSGGYLLPGTRLLRHSSFFMAHIPKKHHPSHVGRYLRCIGFFSARQLHSLHGAVMLKTRSGPTPRAVRQATPSNAKR